MVQIKRNDASNKNKRYKKKEKMLQTKKYFK